MITLHDTLDFEGHRTKKHPDFMDEDTIIEKKEKAKVVRECLAGFKVLVLLCAEPHIGKVKPS